MNKKLFFVNLSVSVFLFVLVAIWISNSISSIYDDINTITQEEEKYAYDNLSSLESAIINTVENAKRSVVSIVATQNVRLLFWDPFLQWWLSVWEKEAKVWWWSGIMVASGGYIITNKHVVENRNVSYSVITHDNKTYNVSNIWMDPFLDIAILRVDRPADIEKHTDIANFVSFLDDIRVGQFVIAIWNAFNELQNTVTWWIISAKNRNIRISWNNIYKWLIQTDTSINPWNSGWPLLDIKSRVIGINTAFNQFAQGISFAIPISQEFVDNTIYSLERENKIVRPFVGIVYRDILWSDSDMSVNYGVYVNDVVPDSPADKIGIKNGDIIIYINDLIIDENRPFLYQLYSYRPWDTIKVSILRSGDLIHRELILE